MPPGSYQSARAFDPALILAQIILLQAVFYASYLACLVALNTFTGEKVSLADQVFNHHYASLRSAAGLAAITSEMFACALPVPVAFTVLVGRSRRAVDFAATLLVSHAVATGVHSGFPTAFAWWGVNVCAVCVLAVVAEALCMRREMRDIPVGVVGKTREVDACGPEISPLI